MSNVLNAMIAALELEAQAVKKLSTSNSCVVQNGKLIKSSNSTWIYQFSIPARLNLPDDCPIMVSTSGQNINGSVLSLQDELLSIAVDQDLGSFISSAKLKWSEADLVGRLISALKNTIRGNASFSHSSALRAIGLTSIKSADLDPENKSGIYDNLNSEQILAVRRSLGSDTLFLWGPPGTGKTHTLARIVEAHCRSGKSILIVSNTNIAVDAALYQVAKRLETEPTFKEGLVQRIGQAVSDDLKSEFGKFVLPDEILARMGAPISRRLRKLRTEISLLISEKRDIEASISNHIWLKQAMNELAQNKKVLNDNQIQLDRLTSEVHQLQSKRSALLGQLERISTASMAEKLFYRLLNPKKVQALQDQVLDIDIAIEQLEADFALESSRIHERKTHISALSEKIQCVNAILTPDTILTELQSRVKQINQEGQGLLEQERLLNKKFQDLQDKISKNCKVSVATASKIYLNSTGESKFDIVIIDEASMLVPPVVYLMAGLARQSATIIGDFRQLPPIVRSNEKLAQKWLSRDVFEISGIPKLLKAGEIPRYLVALKVQYRMCDAICNLVSSFAYPDHALESAPVIRTPSESPTIGLSPILYIDTGYLKPWCSNPVIGKSRFNLAHAILIRKVIRNLQKIQRSVGENSRQGSIAVVSPFRAQVNVIRSLISDSLAADDSIKISTVHRFQGSERDTIILDLTDSIGKNVSRFLSATDLNQEGTRLLNVALSRAKNQLIVLGNFEFLNRKLPESATVRRLIQLLKTMGEEIDYTKSLMVEDSEWVSTEDFTKHFGNNPEERDVSFADQVTFYPSFESDLMSSQKSIVLISPFLTERRVSYWVEHLRSALARGVKIRIRTQPASSHGSETNSNLLIINMLREMGIRVDEVKDTHQKIAMIDGKIFWSGSLNILSHSQGLESMTRIVSEQACSEVYRSIFG